MIRKVVLGLSVVLSLLVFFAGSSSFKFEAPANLVFSQSSSVSLPFSSLSGLAVSGSWKGSGSAQAWVIGEGKRLLVLDSSFVGPKFESVCVESCEFSSFVPDSLLVSISGDGELAIDSFNFNGPSSPVGFAWRVRQSDAPSHTLLVVALLLVICVFGAHVLNHVSSSVLKKRAMFLIFFGSFVILLFLAGFSVFSPTAAVAVPVGQVTSIIAGLGVVSLMVVLCIELLSHDEKVIYSNSAWKDMEDPDEKWEK